MKLEGFAFGFLQDGNVGVGVFPKRKEILIRFDNRRGVDEFRSVRESRRKRVLWRLHKDLS